MKQTYENDDEDDEDDETRVWWLMGNLKPWSVNMLHN